MAISDTQKVDLLFKKVAFGLSKTDVASNKSASNESIASEVPTYANNIWTQSTSIPATPPASSSSLVEVYTVANGNSHINLTQDATATPLRTFKTNLTDWIPFSFGAQYAVKVYIGDPASGGSQIFPDGSGNSDEYYFDYQAGVLNFIGDNLPSGVSASNVYIQGYRYIGTKGITGAGGANSTRTFADIAARDADSDVSAGDLAIVTDNGDGEYAIYIANAGGPTSSWTLVSTKDSAEASNTFTATVNWNDASSITDLAYVSQNTRITNMIVTVITPFDATGASLSIGTQVDSDQFMLADEIGLEAAGDYIGFSNYVFGDAADADNEISFEFVQGTGGSAGQAEITVVVA